MRYKCSELRTSLHVSKAAIEIVHDKICSVIGYQINCSLALKLSHGIAVLSISHGWQMVTYMYRPIMTIRLSSPVVAAAFTH